MRAYVQKASNLHIVGWLLTAGALATMALLLAGQHTALVLLAAGFSLASSAVAWHQRDAEWWVRMPLLSIPPIILAQVGLSLTPVQQHVPFLSSMVHPAICALPVAALLIPMIVLSVPNPSHTQRIGGRARKQQQLYQSAALLATISAWALVAGGSLLRDGLLRMPIYTAGMLVLSSTVLYLSWQTWRTRRTDPLLLGTGSAAFGLLLLVNLAWWQGIGPLSALHIVTSTLLIALWIVLVGLTTLAYRRPAPDLAPRAVPTAVIPAAERKPSLLADYISLTKPKVISLLLVTTLAAMYITDQGLPSLALVFWTMLGGYLASGGAGAINCAFEKDVDINMGRTSRRPVPSGRIAPAHAMIFGITLVVLSFVVLATFATLAAAILALIGAFYYAVAYTVWLKRNTWQNIVIGGGAGAIPPMVGWAAMTGDISLTPVILFLIIFYWTPPHFWALALVKQKDYARAGIPMLPVVAGAGETRWQIWLYSVLLVWFSFILTPIGAMGGLYLILAALLGGVFLYYAWRTRKIGDQAAIWGLYKYSLLYLALLFGAMVLDRLLLGA